MMNRFIRINGKDYSFDEVAKALGIKCDPQREPIQLHLCQRVDDGILVAKGAFFDNDDYPAMDLELELPAEKDSMPVIISKTEQPRVDGGYSDGYQGVRNFVYNRDGEYFMYSDVDSRADEIVDRDGMEQRVMVSGSPVCDAEVYQENHYVRMMGRKEFEYNARIPVLVDVKLEVGMVGVLRDSNDIKRSLRGKAFEILEVNEEYGCAKCRIDGEKGEFGVYVLQMAKVEKPLTAVLENATARASISTARESNGMEKEGLF